MSAKGSKTSQGSQTPKGSKASKESSDSLMAFFYTEQSVEEEEVVEEVKEEEERSTFFTHKYVKTTYQEYKNEQLKEAPVFAEVLTLDDDGNIAADKKSAEEPSILMTGFGMRNLESLQNALQEEQRRLAELYKSTGSSQEEGYARSSLSSRRSECSGESRKSSETETERSSIRTDLSAQRMQLQYLMGLEAEAEEEHVEEAPPVEVTEDDFVYSTSKSTKAAQRYLRTHRVFDFFQLIIAHLLSAMPDNPIDFILIYLNKCLCYRAGLGTPPLLYEQKHIEQLYKLMDRMDIGFIDLEQYDKAMATMGICEYNKEPPRSADGMVRREFFIQEALESETAIFDDLIRRRWIGQKPPSEAKAVDVISASDSGPYFIPSDLMLKFRQYQFADVVGATGEAEEGGTHEG